MTILYLGSYKWPKWFKKLLPYHILFNEAAKRHDEGYAALKRIPKNSESFDRKQIRAVIDVEFYEDMGTAIKECNRSYFYKLGAQIFRLFYCCCVRELGWYYSRYKND